MSIQKDLAVYRWDPFHNVFTKIDLPNWSTQSCRTCRWLEPDYEEVCCANPRSLMYWVYSKNKREFYKFCCNKWEPKPVRGEKES